MSVISHFRVVEIIMHLLLCIVKEEVIMKCQSVYFGLG